MAAKAAAVAEEEREWAIEEAEWAVEMREVGYWAEERQEAGGGDEMKPRIAAG